MDRIIGMIFRRLLNRGIRHGINHAANRGKDPSDMTPEEREAASKARQNGKRANQALRITRRMGRF